MKTALLVLALVAAALSVQGIDVDRIQRSHMLLRHRMFHGLSMEDIECKDTKMGFEKEVRLKDSKGNAINANGDDEIESTCNYDYGTSFGKVMWDGKAVLDAKADDHCKFELASEAAVNHGSKFGDIKKDHMGCALLAAVNILSCKATMKDCLDAKTLGKCKGKPMTFTWASTISEPSPTKKGWWKGGLTAKAKSNLEGWKIKSALGQQVTVGIPFRTYSPAWNKDSAAKALIYPYEARKGDSAHVVFTPAETSICNTKTVKSEESTWFCYLLEANRHQFVEVQKIKKSKKKDSRSIMPKLTYTGIVQEMINDLLGPGKVDKGKINALNDWTKPGPQSQYPAFKCEEPGLVVEVRNGKDQGFLDPLRTLFRGGKKDEKTCFATSEKLFKLQEDIWKKAAALGKPPSDPPSGGPEVQLEQGKAPAVVHDSPEDGDCRKCCTADKHEEGGKCIARTKGASAVLQQCKKDKVPCDKCTFTYEKTLGLAKCTGGSD